MTKSCVWGRSNNNNNGNAAEDKRQKRATIKPRLENVISKPSVLAAQNLRLLLIKIKAHRGPASHESAAAVFLLIHMSAWSGDLGLAGRQAVEFGGRVSQRRGPVGPRWVGTHSGDESASCCPGQAASPPPPIHPHAIWLPGNIVCNRFTFLISH